MVSYPALWRTKEPGHGVEYRAVTVISEPVFGHVKRLGFGAGKWAIPVAELVGVDGDGYAVITPGARRWMPREGGSWDA